MSMAGPQPYGPGTPYESEIAAREYANSHAEQRRREEERRRRQAASYPSAGWASRPAGPRRRGRARPITPLGWLLILAVLFTLLAAMS